MIYINGESLTIEDVISVSREYLPVVLSPEAHLKMEASRNYIEQIISEGSTVYGVNTGLGKLRNITISKEELRTLQYNLLKSHSCGAGEPLEEEIVRSAMLLRANTLAKGYSGVRPDVVYKLLELLNNKVTPFVPEQGSVGASGDLAPLAHIGLTLIGEGKAFYNGELLPGNEALLRAGIEPLKLEPKEGLSLINGTQIMTALGVKAIADSMILLKLSDIIGAISLEAILATDTVFNELLYRVRPYRGQKVTAENFRKLLYDSEIVSSHKSCSRVQDPYSFRCIPQVHGIVKDAFKFSRNLIEIELNASNDNPLVFPEEKLVLSGGNFHGQPLAFALNALSIALCYLGNISERRIDKLLSFSEGGLPAFLSAQDGLNSGFMIAQYTAASLCNENKILAYPGSVDSIPTSGGYEDLVSMGTTAGRFAKKIIENLFYILAIELVVALQALDFRKPLKPGAGTRLIYSWVREEIPPLNGDRFIYSDIQKAFKMLKSGVLIKDLEKELGEILI